MKQIRNVVERSEVGSCDTEAPTFYRVFIVSRSLGPTMKAFSSESNFKMYKDFKHISKYHPCFNRAKELQDKFKGYPILYLKRNLNVKLGFSEERIMTIYHCLPSGENGDRLYNKSDNKQLVEVYRKDYISYARYRLKFESTEVILVIHRRLPIADFNVGEARYRFLRQQSFFERTGYFGSDLYMIGRNQISLVDDLVDGYKINPKNKLVGNAIINCIVPPILTSARNLSTPYKLGRLTNNHWLTFGTDHKFFSLSLLSDSNLDSDANNTVTFEALAILCVSMVLPMYDHEDSIHRRRRDRNKRHNFP